MKACAHHESANQALRSAPTVQALSLERTSDGMSAYVAPRGMLMEFLIVGGPLVGNLAHMIADHESEVCARETW